MVDLVKRIALLTLILLSLLAGMHGVQASEVHDVAVIDVTHVLPYGATATYPTGWWVNISVTVRNEGDFSETFNVTVYANTTVIDMETVTSLAPGENTTLTFIWTVPDPSLWIPYPPKYTISAEAEVVSGETNTDNNAFTNGSVAVKFPGDVNGDGKVDFWDLLPFCRGYGGIWPYYNPNADFNCNGAVDFWDLLIFCRHYGISVV